MNKKDDNIIVITEYYIKENGYMKLIKAEDQNGNDVTNLFKQNDKAFIQIEKDIYDGIPYERDSHGNKIFKGKNVFSAICRELNI